MSEKLASHKKVGGGGYNTLIIDNNGGTFDSLSARTFDMKVYLPNDYQRLTIDNFYLKSASLTYSGYNHTQISNSLPTSYNPETGILYCGISMSFENSYSFFISYKIAVIY